MIADLVLGPQIMQLVSEEAGTNGLGASQATKSSPGCSDDGCEIDQEKA